MPDHETQLLQQIESHVLATCQAAPARIPTIAAKTREAMQSPTMPDSIVITAICNLSDKGAIISEIKDGFLFYSVPASPCSPVPASPLPPESPHA